MRTDVICSQEGSSSHPVGQIFTKIGQGGESILRKVNPLSLLPNHENNGENRLSKKKIKENLCRQDHLTASIKEKQTRWHLAVCPLLESDCL